VKEVIFLAPNHQGFHLLPVGQGSPTAPSKTSGLAVATSQGRRGIDQPVLSHTCLANIYIYIYFFV
jgi:hypothetical protein